MSTSCKQFSELCQLSCEDFPLPYYISRTITLQTSHDIQREREPRRRRGGGERQESEERPRLSVLRVSYTCTCMTALQLQQPGRQRLAAGRATRGSQSASEAHSASWFSQQQPQPGTTNCHCAANLCRTHPPIHPRMTTML